MTMRFLFLLATLAVVDGFQFMKNWKVPSRNKNQDLIHERFGNKKLVVLTGAESELGKKTIQELLATGEYHVIGGVKSIDSGINQKDFTPIECDLESFSSVRSFCSKVEEYRLGKPLDRLVCHAGGESEQLPSAPYWTNDSHERNIQVNFLSPFLMIGLLLEGMEDSFDARLTLVCPPEAQNANIADLVDLKGFERNEFVKVPMVDGEEVFNAKKAVEDAKLCQKLLTNFLHEKYHKLNHVSFNDISLDLDSGESEKSLFQVIHDSKFGATKSGVSWSENSSSSIFECEEDEKCVDIDKAYKLFSLSQDITKSRWPKIKVVTSPCPTLKVIGAVTKAQVQKQELKRMREMGRPGISEPEVVERVTKRQKIAAVFDKIVSFVLANTVKRTAKVVTSKVLGEFPEEAVNNYIEKISEEDVFALEREIFQSLSEEQAKKKLTTDKKLVVLTGTSSGLGKKAALALLRSGDYHVIGAVRDLDKMEAVAEVDGFPTDSFTPMYCEMNSFESVRDFCEKVDHFRGNKPIDRIICNTGIYQPSLRYAKWSLDDHEQTMQTNFLSHFLMISKLMPGMANSDDPRITMVGSVTGNDNTVGGGGVYPIADLHDLDGFEAGFKRPIEMADGYGFIGAKAYKDSKLCLMILANFLHAKYHKTTGIAFSSMYPGCIAESPLFREKRAWFRAYFPTFMKFITGGFVGEHEAGQRLFQVAHDPRCKKSGVYWSWNGGPREGRGAEALEKEGQISGGGGAGGGWDSIFENDQSGKVLSLETGFNLFQYATKITGADWSKAESAFQKNQMKNDKMNEVQDVMKAIKEGLKGAEVLSSSSDTTKTLTA